MSGSPQELAELALPVAREAAALILEHGARGVDVEATKSSDVDVVTLADRAAEELIRSRLLAARPDDSVLGEEGDDVTGSTGVRWIVDPIDGTVNFLYGLPEFSVSIAAEVDGDVVAGVVLDAAKDRAYVGYVDPALPGGGSATRDGRALAVRGPAPVGQRLIATGFSYSAEKRAVQAAAVARMLPFVRDIRRHGSCALELSHVAEGALDGYVEEGVNLWDYAAGGLIARLAGARLVVLPGAGGTDLVVCGPDHGFDELVDLAVKAGFTRE
ncbi:inositol monophosphatase family protein [Nocardioides bizhenqiangii]|uniref:inositol-phosphate phosphatase n=1 Tax=Nocardioides bizhenqiangii TaxID=3095076 RepID=A0ABZ0ZMC4_9ACTN|nr:MULTISPECIES: inositol monophosphatase family protein [unclassified Nocardioides]MDZ5620545.1 inositol monophosphatase family protein [Nocardioides sp. HM23]WQQ24916.1 inositol monophosphatase family protein [Nocardioides sp. HM61]